MTEEDTRLRDDFNIIRWENCGNHESSTKERNNINIFIPAGEYYDLASKWNNNNRKLVRRNVFV